MALGWLYEILVAGEETGGNVTVMRMTAPAGTGSPPHTHPGEESLYVLDGELNVHIGDDVVPAQPGAAFHFPAGTHEGFEATTQATVLVTYTPSGIDRFFAEVVSLRRVVRSHLRPTNRPTSSASSRWLPSTA